MALVPATSVTAFQLSPRSVDSSTRTVLLSVFRVKASRRWPVQSTAASSVPAYAARVTVPVVPSTRKRPSSRTKPLVTPPVLQSRHFWLEDEGAPSSVVSPQHTATRGGMAGMPPMAGRGVTPGRGAASRTTSVSAPAVVVRPERVAASRGRLGQEVRRWVVSPLFQRVRPSAPATRHSEAAWVSLPRVMAKRELASETVASSITSEAAGLTMRGVAMMYSASGSGWGLGGDTGVSLPPPLPPPASTAATRRNSSSSASLALDPPKAASCAAFT